MVLGVAVYMARAKMPERGDMVTVCSRSGGMQSETLLKNAVGNQGRFFRFLSLIRSNCVMLLELVLGWHMDNTPPVPGTVALYTV